MPGIVKAPINAVGQAVAFPFEKLGVIRGSTGTKEDEQPPSPRHSMGMGSSNKGDKKKKKKGLFAICGCGSTDEALAAERDAPRSPSAASYDPSAKYAKAQDSYWNGDDDLGAAVDNLQAEKKRRASAAAHPAPVPRKTKDELRYLLDAGEESEADASDMSEDDMVQTAAPLYSMTEALFAVYNKAKKKPTPAPVSARMAAIEDNGDEEESGLAEVVRAVNTRAQNITLVE